MDCIFCRIAKGEIPAHVLYEDERSLVFLDIQPGTRGHALAIPKRHSRDFLELPAADRDAVLAAARRVAEPLMAATGAEGLNLHQANGEVAGQVIMHFHLHLLPRRRGDGLRAPWHPKEAATDDLAALAGGVRAAIAASDK